MGSENVSTGTMAADEWFAIGIALTTDILARMEEAQNQTDHDHINKLRAIRTYVDQKAMEAS